MRNLRLLNIGQVVPESQTCPDLAIVDAVFDVSQNSIIFALTLAESGILEVQQFSRSGETAVLASFPSGEGDLLSFAHFGDEGLVVCVFSSGEIFTAAYDTAAPDEASTVVELVGSIDVGIKAAEWASDEETLAVLTAENTLVLLSRLLEPVAEKVLDQNDINITDSKHVSVGWGKKETQFKGKGARASERERDALKHAGLAENSLLKDPTVGEVERGTLSSADTNTAKISWRGDSAYVAVSTAELVAVQDTGESYDRRVIRVFSREGELESVSEAVDGLEQNLAWRPQGHMAATQRHMREPEDDGEPEVALECLDIVFFEKNGLRHGEFDSRLDETDTVLDLQWSCDSSVLAVACQRGDKRHVQLWTTKNYHWYLKQDLEMDGLSFLKFHPEKPLHLMLGSAQELRIVDLVLALATGPTYRGMDSGTVLVVDGCELKVTPMAVANVPPPMAYREIELGDTIVDTACGASSSSVVAMTTGGIFVMDVPSKGPSRVVAKELFKDLVQEDEFARQIAVAGSQVAVLVDGPTQRVLLFKMNENGVSLVDSLETPSRMVLLKAASNYDSWVLEASNGALFRLKNDSIEQAAKFPQLCRDFEFAVHGDNFSAFGISANGRLFAGEKQLCAGVTSLKVTESHLLFTTVRNHLCFVHLSAQYEDFDETKSGSDERVRQIEQGSLLVTAMPSKYSVVLQAPRGNLETICPRIMVLTAVRDFISKRQYGEAFMACRVHRIDLDILHDYAPNVFYDNVELFVRQVSKVEHLDLFVSCLHEEDVTKTKYRDTLGLSGEDGPQSEDNGPEGEKNGAQNGPHEKDNHENEQHNTSKRIIRHSQNTPVVADSKVNRICNLVIEVLSKPEFFGDHLQNVVTAYACQNPPNLTKALQLIGNLENNELAELALEHLCFLQDVHKLYKTALGIYNVPMALTVAQKSQMDPKEYLPFLQKLHEQEELRRNFLIDDHLRNFEKALSWLHQEGPAAEHEFDSYVVEHRLYQRALRMCHDNDGRTMVVTKLFADFLWDEKKYAEAAVSYEFLGDKSAACESYVACRRWREALALADQQKTGEVAEKLVSLLIDDHRYADAAVVLKEYLHQIDEAVSLYCQSYRYDEALLLVTQKDRPDLLATIDSRLGEGFGTIAELLADCKGQMESQLRRLRELRSKKREDPYGFYDNPEADTPDNVSVAASETSTAPSFFTRYTGKTSGTAKTGASRKTAKNKKREERKRAKGRKGTIYEEEYLIRSVGRLVERLELTLDDGARLVEGLLRRRRKEQAYQIQQKWLDLEQFIRENLDEVHKMDVRDRERVDENGAVYLIDEISVPTLRGFKRVPMLDY